MADNPPPKKKSRLREFLTTFKPQKPTHSGQAAKPNLSIAVSSSYKAISRPLAPGNEPDFGQSHNPSSHDLSNPAPSHVLAPLISPTSATAAALKSLSVDDHKPESVSAQEFRRNNQNGIHQAPPLLVPTQAVLSVAQQNLPLRSVPEAPSPSVAGSNGPKPNIHRLNPPALPLPTSIYAPSYIRPRVKPTVDLDRIPDAPQLPPPGYKPGIEPTPKHPGTDITNLSHHYYNPHGHRTSSPPKNLYTSPEFEAYQHTPSYRKDLQAQNVSLKRKRTNPGIFPPPAYIYTRTNDSNFNIFQGFLLYPELCYQLAMYLPISDLIALYAISRDYHTILDTRFTTTIVSIAQHLAPTAFRIFPFRCFAHLCRTDPAARIPHPDPKLAAKGAIRKIPSFKWLKMLVYREKVVHEIMAIAAERGVPFPRRCKQSLLKMWFMLDIPDNPRRIGFTHNPQLLDDLDLYFGMTVVVKLDMLFNDPVGTEKRDGARRLLMSQRSLTPLLLVLKGEIWKTKLDIMREWVKWKYEPSERDWRECGGVGIFGVPLEICGRLKYEYWGKPGCEKLMKRDEDGKFIWLMRPDQLIIREVVRRGFRFGKAALRAMLYGYVDMRTLQDLDWAKEGRDGEMRRREKLLEGHDEYDFDDLVGGARCVAAEDGGDGLLDLGSKVSGSQRFGKEEMGGQEARWRKGEKDFMMRCYNWWEEEMMGTGRSLQDVGGWESD